MFKTKFIRQSKSDKSLEEIYRIVQNELDIVGHANVSSKGRIGISEFIQKTSDPFATTKEAFGVIRKDGNDVYVELTLRTRSHRIILFVSIFTIPIFIGLFMLPTFIILFYMSHLKAKKSVKTALDNIVFDID